MKFYFILFSLCISRAYSQENILKAEIDYVNKGVLANHRISCTGFDSVFFKIKNYYVINDKDTLRQLFSILKGVKLGKKSSRLDVRLKAKIYYSDGHVTTICFDDFGEALLDEKAIKKSGQLFRIVNTYRK